MLKDEKMKAGREIVFPQRDHNGDLMTAKAIELQKKHLWQRSKFMQPVIVSPSLKVEKIPAISKEKK